MGYLENLNAYLAGNYEVSVFDTAMASKKPWEMHLHGHRTATAAVLENRKWDITVDIVGQGREEIQKIQIKYLHPAEAGESIKPLLKMDQNVEALKLEPIFNPRKRYFIKNKSLYPLMKEKEVVLFTLLEGDVLRGIIADFSRYDVTVHLKGGLPVTILRHSIYDVRNKRGRCFLKAFQEEHRDWEKSRLYVA